MQARGVDAVRRPGGIDAGCGGGRHWRGQERQEETPSDSHLGAREGVVVDRVRRGGTDDQKRNPSHSRLKRGAGVGGTRQGGVAGINKVSCKFHVTLFGCWVGGDVGQLGVVWLWLRVARCHATGRSGHRSAASGSWL